MTTLDFDSWFASQRPFTQARKELPVGVWDDDEGNYFSQCRCCEKTCKLDFDISEIEGMDEYKHYCGGSQWCLP
jgi:hypothetical protein